ncbi:LAQU0S05e03532g1_1 [Lachancea quebecensis]|uniref:LAQU0S05e03532g1_1 n=1 Tax=Lachancea quebecensis TaxID=1654605 RepID=A0A0P1KRM5_9SACH|nr:LAQU0S05e03532g1_1 [Lachancea quebecensis]
MQALEEHYKPFLSSRVEARKFSPFWGQDLPEGLIPHPKPIDLGPGLPHEGFFPLESMHLNVVEDPFQHTSYNTKSRKLHKPAPETSTHFDERRFVSDKLSSESAVDVWRYEPDSPGVIPLSQGLQYTDTAGMKPMLDFCRGFISYAHPPAYDEWDVTLANGSSDASFKIFETLCDSSVTVLVEEFTFSPTLAIIAATGGTAVPVKLDITADPDLQGINVDHLTDLLENWTQGPNAHLSKPKLLYTIPTGQNPTGMTLSLEKRKQIYALAEKHDFIIIEDDPYGYLRYPFYDRENPGYNPYALHEYTAKDYCEKVLAKSFITMDTSGRVLRCETFSKVFCPGLRLSFVAGNKFLIKKLVDFAEVSSRAPSGVSQLIVNNVIQKWAKNHSSPQEAWLTWVMKVAGHYTHRRNMFVQALEATEAFGKGLFSLAQTTAGMFLAVEVNFDQFAKALNTTERSQAMQRLKLITIEEGVGIILGINMAVDRHYSLARSFFLRLTFAFAADVEELQEAAVRLSKAFKRFATEF